MGGEVKRGARGAESSGVLLGRLVNARESARAVQTALHGAKAAGAGEVCRRLRAARASLGGVVRHLERLHAEASAREFRERHTGKRCGWCGVTVWPDGRGSWVDATGGDGCGEGVHAPESSAGLDR